MKLTNIHETKTHLSKLIERVEAGEEIIIGRAGKPVAKLVPYKGEKTPVRKPGYWKGKVRIGKDFDALPENILAAFRGELP